MSNRRDPSPWASPTSAPPTEADPSGREDMWVTAGHAAGVLGRSKEWVEEQCRAERLPSRRDPKGEIEDLLVPMARARELATQAD